MTLLQGWRKTHRANFFREAMVVTSGSVGFCCSWKN